jgi:hypothetical protein
MKTSMERMMRHGDDVFNAYRRKCAKWAKKVGMRKVAAPVGRHGPYYWVYLKPSWILKAMPLDDESQTMDHGPFWSSIVDQLVAPHYGITSPADIRELKNAPYAMPRGRLVSVKDTSGERRFVFWNGEDFKTGDKERKALIQAFGLDRQWVEGRVRFSWDEHEVVIPHDLEVFKRIISMPAKDSKKILPKPAPL